MNSSKQIVLLGIGHTNCHFINEWAKNPIVDCDLFCISPFDNATYSGMMPGALSTQFTNAQWRVDLSKLCNRASANLIVEPATSIDRQTREISFAERPSLRFDALSIGIGSVPAGGSQFWKVPEVIPIKPMQTFIERLNASLNNWESRQDANLQIAIVGGGVASIEIAFCLDTRLRSLLADAFQIRIISASDELVPELSSTSRRRLLRLLEQRGIDCQLSSRVKTVAGRLVASEQGTTSAADIVIWATGASPPSLLGQLDLATDDQGFIATHDTLQSISDPHIFAVGDSGTVISNPSPKAGVYAVRQSPILSHNLRAAILGGPMKRFRPQARFLKLLNTGDGQALLEYGRLTIHSRWCLWLKNWIDKKFVSQFQNLP